MEYLEGIPLDEQLQKGPLPIHLTLRYAVEIADALDKAHRLGVVHRDLKPANVILTNSGIKLLDFGLAKLQSTVESDDDAATVPAGGKGHLTEDVNILDASVMAKCSGL